MEVTSKANECVVKSTTPIWLTLLIAALDAWSVLILVAMVGAIILARKETR